MAAWRVGGLIFMRGDQEAKSGGFVVLFFHHFDKFEIGLNAGFLKWYPLIMTNISMENDFLY